jgi:hypothetical protein
MVLLTTFSFPFRLSVIDCAQTTHPDQEFAMKHPPVADIRVSQTPVPVDPQSEVLRELLVEADLTMPRAAQLLDIREQVLRGYCMGKHVPRVVILALERLVDMEREVKQPRNPHLSR